MNHSHLEEALINLGGLIESTMHRSWKLPMSFWPGQMVGSHNSLITITFANVSTRLEAAQGLK